MEDMNQNFQNQMVGGGERETLNCQDLTII